MPKIKWFSLSAALLLVLSTLTSCSGNLSSKPSTLLNKPHTIQELQHILSTYKSYSIRSHWIYSCPALPITVIKGSAWVDSYKENFIYTNSYSNTQTILLVYNQKLSAPLDTHPLKEIPLSSPLSSKRIKGDMFANDPLLIASTYPLTLKFKNLSTLSNSTTLSTQKNSRQTGIKITTSTSFQAYFDSKGFIDKIEFTHPLGNPGCLERIVYDFDSVNSTSVKKIMSRVKYI